MHTKILHLVFAVVISCFAQYLAYSQQPSVQTDSNNTWIRVQSDNGEFSIEVPAKHKFYSNEDGFTVTVNSNDYRLTNMRMLNSYSAGTLLSFEVYKAKKGAVEGMYERDVYRRNDTEKSEIKRNDYSIRQATRTTDKAYSTRQYFYSKSHIYILTALSRGQESPVARRFLDSLVFKPNTKDAPESSAVLLSKLPVTDIIIEQQLDKDVATPRNATPPDKIKDENIIPVAILHKPQASFVAQARQNRVTGAIRLKPTLSADGSVSNIVIVKTLPDGLLRQALFAAFRLKFLPKENYGKPETTVVTIEYTFDIY